MPDQLYTNAGFSCAQLDYWGDRFRRLHIAGLCGCTFEQYLRRPAYYEGIAEARRHLARSRARVRLRTCSRPGTPSEA